MKINLHIERLIVEGMSLTAREKDQLSSAIRQQLLGQLTERGLAADLNGLAGQRTVNGGAMSLMDADQPGAIGQKIGTAIYRGIGNGG